MKAIDLTHPIAPGMPVYPGTKPVSVAAVATLEREGYTELRVALATHTGTHIDAPAHMIAGGKTLDDYPAAAFAGQALAIDATAADPEITAAQLAPLAAWRGRIDFALIRTGWSARWGLPGYYEGYPFLTPEAAHFLAALGLKGVGLDTPSPDPAASRDYPAHRALFARDVLIIENLADLSQLPPTPFHFACLPLKIENADGAPARAVALSG